MRMPPLSSADTKGPATLWGLEPTQQGLPMATLLSPPVPQPPQPEATAPRLFSATRARLEDGHSPWIGALVGASVHRPPGVLPALMEGWGQQLSARCSASYTSLLNCAVLEPTFPACPPLWPSRSPEGASVCLGRARAPERAQRVSAPRGGGAQTYFGEVITPYSGIKEISGDVRLVFRAYSLFVCLVFLFLFYTGIFPLCPAGKIFAKSGTGPWLEGQPPVPAQCPIPVGRGAWGFSFLHHL